MGAAVSARDVGVWDLVDMASRQTEAMGDYMAAMHAGRRDADRHRRAYVRRGEAVRRLALALERRTGGAA